jgi:Sulfotransferase domain
MNKIFILGVGAQKAGTTWLSQFLPTNKKIALNEIKEMNLWNTLEQRSPHNIDIPRKIYEVIVKYFHNNPDHYFEYYSQGLMAKLDYAYDISPNYAGLSPETFTHIKNEFAKRGINTKVIFIMRDPIDRLVSSYKHAVRLGEYIKSHTGYPENIHDQDFAKYATTDFIKHHARYDITFNNVVPVFGSINVLCLIYEDLFNKRTIHKISDFLGLEFDENFADNKINAAPQHQRIDISEDMLKEIAVYYIDVYRFALKEFPEVKSLWPSFKYVEDIL